MHRDRMEKVLSHLRDNVKDDRFDLVTWAGNEKRPWGGRDDLSCGTVACVMGHATTIPEFRELGLRLVSGGSFLGYITYRRFRSFRAVGSFLDISNGTVDHLFFAGNYPNGVNTTRQEVIDRITAYLANNSSHEDHFDEAKEIY